MCISPSGDGTLGRSSAPERELGRSHRYISRLRCASLEMTQIRLYAAPIRKTFYSLLASIFLFISVAVTAAEKPLSILTAVTPEAQLLSIVKRAESPSNAEP
jgi:hypothetical protein